MSKKKKKTRTSAKEQRRSIKWAGFYHNQFVIFDGERFRFKGKVGLAYGSILHGYGRVQVFFDKSGPEQLIDWKHICWQSPERKLLRLATDSDAVMSRLKGEQVPEKTSIKLPALLVSAIKYWEKRR